MELLSAALALASCAAMSLWCHRRMSRGPCAPHADDTEVSALRAEIAALRVERSEPVRERT